VIKGRVEKAEDKEPRWLRVEMEASHQRPPDLRLSRVAFLRLQEPTKRGGVDELVKGWLLLTGALEPVAEGDRVEVALEFLEESQTAGNHG